MQPKTVAEIRDSFLNYFKSHNHKIVPSSSLLPQGDPSLLFTTAGMVQFKPFFSGSVDLPYTKATSSQKCLRTTDLENVGKTERHCTFFEMLGNFSFGDYFKKGSIEYALDFSIKHLGFPKESIWISIYDDDDEAEAFWLELGIPREKIVRLGKKDNFWGPAGDTGACGPCSELYLDRGSKKGFPDCGTKPGCKPGCDCDRFIEYWNLVFNQFNQDKNGNLNPLKQTGIDTGAGLERLAMLIQNVDSVYDTDELKKILESIEKLTGESYTENTASSFRVIADHTRAACFALSDGILPDKTGRGYVIRRLIRRAALYSRKIGITEPLLFKVAEKVVQLYGKVYPELLNQKDTIFQIIKSEEELFLNTLEQGLEVLEEMLESYEKTGRKIFEGKDSFKLYGTFGFPKEMTKEILAEKKIEFDDDGFEKELENDRQISRETWTGNQTSYASLLDGVPITEFVGYKSFESTSKILKLFSEENVERNQLSESEKGIIILDKTSFYGESGGQIGDTGIIMKDQSIFRVTDTKKENDYHIHIGYMEKGKLEKTDIIQCKVDIPRRKNLTYHHSGTHLLNGALRSILGSHVMQKSSLVSDSYLRFDFSHTSPLSSEEIETVEKKVNKAIKESISVTTQIMPIEKAKQTGAVAAFDEKYGSEVRIVEMGDASIEFCGGCHVDNTGEIKYFTILKESSPGAGIRRIEALCGPSVITYFESIFHELKNQISEIESELNFLDLPAQVLKLNLNIKNEFSSRGSDAITFLKNEKLKYEENINKNKEKIIKEKKSREKTKNKSLLELDNKILDQKIEKSGIEVLPYIFENNEKPDAVKQLGDKLKNKNTPVLILFAIKNSNSVILIFMANKEALQKGINCNILLKETAPLVQGKGGGKPDMAQGGGKDVEKINDVFKKAIELIGN